MRDGRQIGNVRPECQIALCRENLLLPDPGPLTLGVLQELNSWQLDFAWELCSIRCRFRARFRPPDFSSRNFRFPFPSFRLSLLRSIPPAP